VLTRLKKRHMSHVMYLPWMADNMWLFVPIQDVLGELFQTLPDYPMQQGQLMNPAAIDYQSLGLKGKMQQLDQLQKQVEQMK
jgi:arylsulfatase